MKLIKIIIITFIYILILNPVFADNQSEFNKWKKNFRQLALQKDISAKTFDEVMLNTKFLPNVIKYDRYQPEFYEDTKTYISKRTSLKKLSKGKLFYNENVKLINSIEEEFNILFIEIHSFFNFFF